MFVRIIILEGGIEKEHSINCRVQYYSMRLDLEGPQKAKRGEFFYSSNLQSLLIA